MKKITRALGGELDNTLPQETVEVGKFKVEGSGIGSGDVGVVERSVVIDSGGTSASISMSARTR